MFIDASAIVAILAEEAEADALTEAMQAAQAPITSAIAIYEAVLGLARKRQANLAASAEVITQFLRATQVRTVPITEADSEGALAAATQYGKGRGHPAQLNMGDCFAYAIAKRYDVEMLFKGDDFSKTDIRPAAP